MLKSIFTILVYFYCYSIINAQNIYKEKILLMGVDFEFVVVASTQEKGNYFLKQAINEVLRIENNISSWKKNSQTSLINTNAGIQPVKVSKDLYQLIRRSKRISTLTNGYFDISFASIDKIWHFDKPIKKIPSEESIQNSVAKINYNDIILNDTLQTVFLKEQGMKISFGAIGKGFTAEKVKQKLQQLGATGGLINASGDIACWGEHPKTKQWKIAITNPNKTKDPIAWFDLSNTAVVTSGNYEKYAVINNTQYTHIINPKTGWPVNELKSVTVFCKNAELADALATAVFVMGKNKGTKLINQLKDVECLMIDNNNRISYSKTLNTTYSKNTK